MSLDDPRRLGFSYLRHLAAVLDSTAHRHTPQRILHLGGGALSLPRYVAAVRPSAIQVVVEHDRALVALVSRVLPLPADADITIRIDDARTFIESTMATFDAVVVNVALPSIRADLGGGIAGLQWVVDGYTTSAAHPYARPIQAESVGEFNYIRNSVKATVDAYDGSVPSWAHRLKAAGHRVDSTGQCS